MSDIPAVFTGNRVETFWVEALDENDNPVEVMTRTSGGVVTQNIDAPIRGGFQIVTQQIDKPFDYMRTRLRPWVMVNGQKWPLGVYLPSSPDVAKSSTQIDVTIPCHDKTIILDQDKIAETYSLPVGTPVVQAATDVILSVGEDPGAVTPSDAVTTSPMTWAVGTSRLTIVNDLLRSVNYSSLWADGFGHFRIQPHFEPSQRVPRYTFQQGEFSIHSPNWNRSRDIANVPNRVILIATGTDSQDEMIAVAENTDPNSSFSYRARGDRWVTRVYENVEAVSQSALDSLAGRYLANATRAVSTISVSHAVLPMDPGEVLAFESGPANTNVQVKEYSITMKAGALVRAVWTEIGS